MKPIAYFSLIAAIIFIAACRKENVKGTSTLQGNWTLVQTLSDPGDGSGTWQPAVTKTTLGLNADGSVSGTAFSAYDTYRIADSVTLVFNDTDTNLARATGGFQNYRYKISHDTLEMSPDGPVRCIEACGIRFKKNK